MTDIIGVLFSLQQLQLAYQLLLACFGPIVVDVVYHHSIHGIEQIGHATLFCQVFCLISEPPEEPLKMIPLSFHHTLEIGVIIIAVKVTTIAIDDGAYSVEKHAIHAIHGAFATKTRNQLRDVTHIVALWQYQ